MTTRLAAPARSAIVAVAAAALLIGCGESGSPGDRAAESAPRVASEAPPPSDADARTPTDADEPDAAHAPLPEGIPGPIDADALDPVVGLHLARLADELDADRRRPERWLALADALLAHSESAGAALAYEGAIALLPESDPRRERAVYLRAIALEDSGDTETALAVLRPLAAHGEATQVHWRLALLLSGAGELDDAIAAARRAVDLAPDDMQAQAALAQVASQNGAWEIAEAAARAGLRANPRNGHLYGILATSLRAQGRDAEVEPLLGAGRFTRADWLDPWLRALREDRLGFGAATERFYAALRSGDATRAAELLKEAAAGASGEQAGRVALMRAQLAAQVGDAERATTDLEDATRLGASECEVGIVRAMVSARRAADPSQLDEIAAALAALDCTDDQDATRLELIGSIRLAQARWDDAADALVAADSARQGGVGPALRNAIAAMQRAGAFEPALRLAGRLLEAEPLSPQGHLVLASLLLRSGDVDGARRAARTLAELAPDAPATAQLLQAIEQASR